MTSSRAQSAPLIRVDRAYFGYESTPVLQDLSLTIDPQSFSGVVGPSGSGKTSLLRLLLGTVSPQRGEVTRQPGLRLGYVPQLGTVHWNFPVTVEECVLMGSPGRRLPWAGRAERAEAARILDRLNIGALAQRHISELSGGQQQRMFLARALLRRPQLLLLDEPTTGVDVTSRHDMLHLLADLNDEGVAILLTTHDLNGVAAHLPRLVALNGSLIAAGAPREVITSAILERTFGAPMEILEHLGMPVVLDNYHHGTHPARS